MTTGIILAVLALLVCTMLFTKRIRSSRFQKWNHLLHKLLGTLLLLLAIVHLIIVWPLRLQRPLIMYVMGFAMIFLLLIIILSFFLRTRLGKSWRLIHRIAAIGVILCLIVHAYAGIHSLQTYKADVSNITLDEISLEAIPDGTYIGEENVGYIYARVQVEIQNHTLASVKLLEHRTERGKPAEALINRMVEKQSVIVDAVSGATNSSKVIMKAVQNALTETYQ